MSAGQALIDTDTLSAILRGNGVTTTHARTYLARHGQLLLSAITRYEELRGLHSRGAASARRQSEDTFGR